jgi:hypothetical protein
MEISEISIFLIVYVGISLILSIICIRVFKQEDYHAHILSTGVSDMSYTGYVYERVSLNLSEISQKIERRIRNVYYQFVQLSYPAVAKNIIYKNDK